MPNRCGRASEELSGRRNFAAVATPTILGVDDHRLNLELLAEYLAGTDCRFVSASGGQEALDLLDHVRPDLVLLDIMMPGLDGVEVCRRIKASNLLLPVVLVTSLSSVKDRARGLEAGADEFLIKPIDRGELRARVASLLRAKQVLDRLDDPQHVERVARTARALGQAAGLSGNDLNLVYFGGKVHDLGTAGVANRVLLKTGPLTIGETAEMRRHVTIGVEIARRLRSASTLIPIIRHHHERYDGTGYPESLRGDAIPFGARIVSVCDAYDAMTSQRPYREALTAEMAIAELRRGAGSQWDPRLVELFVTRVLQEPAARESSHSPGGR
jgi:putative two-component system response regulator